MDRLTAARVFLEVAERGSLTQAAERLEMSVAMVSRHLASAEHWLGARLLHRTTRRVSLTDAGESAIAGCRQLLDLAAELEHRADDRQAALEGRLRLSTSASFAQAQLAGAVLAFQRHHPGVRIELHVLDRAVDLVEDRIDLAVRITNTLEPHLVTRRLATCRSALCAAPAYLAEHGTPDSAEALAGHACIGHTFGSGTTYRLTRGARTVSVSIDAAFSTTDTLIVHRAVLDGGGIAMLPTYLVADDLRRGTLVRLLPHFEPEPLGIHAVYLSRRHQPLALRALLDFLVDRFGGDVAPWDRAVAAPRAIRARRR